MTGRSRNIFKLILKTIRLKREAMRANRDPEGYARSLGVRLGTNVTLLGIRPGTFSTEPWLITIGDNVWITSGCQFITHDGGTLIFRREVPDLELTAPITIGNDVMIGRDVTILPGVNIGSRVIIGAGSVVAKDIPDNSVAAGNPARVIKTADEYLESAKKRSLHLGHLSGPEKVAALKRHFNVE